MKLKSVKLCIVLALLFLFALNACGRSTESPSAPPPSTQEAGGGGGGKTIEVTERAINWSFSEPEIRANVGDTLKLTMINEVGVHGLKIDEFNVEILDGETATIELDKAGTYEFYCSIQCGQGHDNMVGKIIVE